MNRRGQFFILAAAITALLLLAAVSVYNSARGSSEGEMLDRLSEEIRTELSYSIDYSLIHGAPMDEIVENLTSSYAYLNKDKNIFVLYGSMHSPNSTYFKNGVKSTDFVTIPRADHIDVLLDSASLNFSFDSFEGQNLNIIVKKSIGGEIYVSTA